LGLRVPDEVAILGVDDDEFECKLSHPPLSSVKNPGVQIGYEAAALLDRLMAGEKPEQVRVFLPPLYVAARRSTETTALADPDVAMALIFIREHLSRISAWMTLRRSSVLLAGRWSGVLSVRWAIRSSGRSSGCAFRGPSTCWPRPTSSSQ
jgi:hypothetical protein